MRYIHIRNWDKHQHPDTTRNKRYGPPWIKDYSGQLHDEEFVELGWPERGLLQSLRLQYALNRGRGINDSTTNLYRLFGHRVLRVQLERLNQAGFIEFSASKSLATRLQHASLDGDGDKEPLVVPLKEDVEEVFREWAVTTGHERCKLTGDRERKIKARLGEGYSVEQLKQVPHGAVADPWEDRAKFNDVGVLYRNSQQVDKFLALAESEVDDQESRRNAELYAHLNGGAA